ncbi:hypothetical protein BDQ17DRAFT_1328834 [Cyathus striatus]|nr:hypothetical protein BDQ17DRAFT_1328834 [Cyathus striatus]
MPRQSSVTRLLLLAAITLAVAIVVNATQVMHRPSNYKEAPNRFATETNPKTHVIQRRATNKTSFAYFTNGGSTPESTSTTTTTTTITSTPEYTTTTTTTSTPTGGGSSGQCAGVAAWSSSTAYKGGNTATYGGHLWSAKWWTEADIPGGAAGVWVDEGAC